MTRSSRNTTYRALAIAIIVLNAVVIGPFAVTRPSVTCSRAKSLDPDGRSDPAIVRTLANRAPGRGTYEHCTIARWYDRDGPDRFAVIEGLSAGSIRQVTCLDLVPATTELHRYLERRASISLRHAHSSGPATTFLPIGASLQNHTCIRDSGIYSLVTAESHGKPVAVVNYPS